MGYLVGCRDSLQRLYSFYSLRLPSQFVYAWEGLFALNFGFLLTAVATFYRTGRNNRDRVDVLVR